MSLVVQGSWNTSKMNATQFTSRQSQVGYPLGGFSVGYFNSPASIPSKPSSLYKNNFNPHPDGKYSGIKINLKGNLSKT